MATNKSGGIPLTGSLFASLKLEEDMLEEKKAKRRRNQQNQNNDGANQKKDDRKKKNANESKQLQQLAFGKPGSGNRKKSGKNVNSNNAKAQGQNWDQWKEHDKEVVADQFKQDLEKALLESQLQEEQDKAAQRERKANGEASEEIPKTKEERKKKKQKEKAKPMSLEEFKQLPKEVPKTTHSDDSDEERPSPPPIHYRVPTAEQDAKFFNNVHNEAEQILRQDKMQEDYRKTYAIDNAVVAKLKNDIETRDKTILELKQQVNQMEAEMKQVKHRNKQLCVILAQGEMKDKAQVLLQVDELNNVKDELTEQVTSLTVELEKEKSKNRALKSEADKLKAGGKHGK